MVYLSLRSWVNDNPWTQAYWAGPLSLCHTEYPRLEPCTRSMVALIINFIFTLHLSLNQFTVECSQSVSRRQFIYFIYWYFLNCFFILVKDFHISKTEDQCRAKLREEFERNRGVKDIRVIDMLVIKVSC